MPFAQKQHLLPNSNTADAKAQRVIKVRQRWKDPPCMYTLPWQNYELHFSQHYLLDPIQYNRVQFNSDMQEGHLRPSHLLTLYPNSIHKQNWLTIFNVISASGYRNTQDSLKTLLSLCSRLSSHHGFLQTIFWQSSLIWLPKHDSCVLSQIYKNSVTYILNAMTVIFIYMWQV